MSILSDIGEKVFGLTTDLKLADQKSWLEPLISLGTGALSQRNQDNTRSQYLDYLKQREAQNYQASVADIQAYNDALAAHNASSAARAAAARQTEANRQAASKKANRSMQKTYKEILKMYKPYKDTADTLLPQMSQTYQNSLGLQNALASFVNSPAQVAKLNASVPAWQVAVPLPDSIRIK